MTTMDTQLQVSTSGFFPSALSPSVRLQISCPRSCRGECDRFIPLLVFLLNTGGVAVETDDRGPASRKLPVVAGKFLTSAVNGGWRYAEAAPKGQGRHTWEEAKGICHELEINGYNDWRLPSKKELNLMYENLYKKSIGGIYASAYWCFTSGDTNYDDAMLLSFSDGSWYMGEGNKGNDWSVHAVRVF